MGETLGGRFPPHLGQVSRSTDQEGARTMGSASAGSVEGGGGQHRRSTGPHLHYEVRMNGVAQNPRRFILEE